MLLSTGNLNCYFPSHNSVRKQLKVCLTYMYVINCISVINCDTGGG